MNFKLKIMGTASAMPISDRNPSAQVLDVHGRLFLIDCGENTQRQLVRNHIALQKIDSIFISHIHGDHVFGIFGLLSTMGMLSRPTPLNIYAPVSFGPILKFFMSYYGEGIRFDVKHIPLDMKAPETVYSTKSIEIQAFPLNHHIETFGFLFREKEGMLNIHKESIVKYDLTLTEIGTLKRGEDVLRSDGTLITAAEASYRPFKPRSFAYCSDTAPFDELPDWVRGVDLLYHEATYTAEYAEQAANRHHSTTLQAARCALEAGVGKLIVAHYSSRVRAQMLFERECRSIFAETYAANDGDEFEIPYISGK